MPTFRHPYQAALTDVTKQSDQSTRTDSCNEEYGLRGTWFTSLASFVDSLILTWIVWRLGNIHKKKHKIAYFLEPNLGSHIVVIYTDLKLGNGGASTEKIRYYAKTYGIIMFHFLARDESWKWNNCTKTYFALT